MGGLKNPARVFRYIKSFIMQYFILLVGIIVQCVGVVVCILSLRERVSKQCLLHLYFAIFPFVALYIPTPAYTTLCFVFRDDILRAASSGYYELL